MAVLVNTEDNIIFHIEFLRKITDTPIVNDEYETFIPFGFKLITPEKSYNTKDFVMTVHEIGYLIENLKDVLYTNHGYDYTFDYYNGEALFEMIASYLSEDNLIEVMLWIDKGSITNGVKYGYDEGYRFMVNLDSFENFIRQLSKESGLDDLSVKESGDKI